MGSWESAATVEQRCTFRMQSDVRAVPTPVSISSALFFGNSSQSISQANYRSLPRLSTALNPDANVLPRNALQFVRGGVECPEMG